MKHSLLPLPQQQGIALAAALMFLLVMTILGVQSMQTVIMQEKMTSNAKEYQVSLQAADSALREPERWLDSLKNPNHLKPSCDSTASACTAGIIWADDAFDFITPSIPGWWATQAVAFNDSSGTINSTLYASDGDYPQDVTMNSSVANPTYIVQKYTSYSNLQPAEVKFNCKKKDTDYFMQNISIGYGKQANSSNIVKTHFLKRC